MATAPIPGVDIGSWVLTILVVVFWAILLGVVLFFVWLLWRVVAYKHGVEIWERKGDEVTLFGDDKVKIDNKRGVAYMRFLANKGHTFKNVNFPDTQYLYPKKFMGLMQFGTKIKLLLDNDELVPFQMKLANPHGLEMHTMPTFQKRDFIQRFRSIEEKYKPDPTLAAKLQLAGIGIVAVMVIISVFFLWQQNVSFADKIGSMAESVAASAERIAAMQSNTLASASPG